MNITTAHLQPIVALIAGIVILIAVAGWIAAYRDWQAPRALRGRSAIFRSETLFFWVIITASWLILPYAKTWTGWIQALTAGMPGHAQTWEFFRNTLSSGGLFTGLFVGAMKMTEAEEEEAAEEPEKDAQPAEGPREPADAES